MPDSEQARIQSGFKEKLTQTEELLDRMIQNIPGTVFRCRVDEHWTMMFISDEVEKLTGFPAASFINNRDRSFASIIHPDDQQRVWKTIQKAIQSNQLYELEYRIFFRDGAIRWVHEKAQAVQLPEDPFRALDGVIIDITEQRQAEEFSQQQASLIASLMDTIPDIIFLKDSRGVYLNCNTEFTRYIGLPREHVIGKTDYDLSPKEEADSFWKKDQLTMKTGKPLRFEEWISYPDGSRVLLEVLKTPFRDPKGKIIGVIGISRDITERVTANRLIRELNERLLTVLNSIEAFIYIADMNTYDLLFVNEYGLNVWDKGIIGKKCWKVLQKNQEGPCSFCTNDKLLNEDGSPTGVYKWEFQNTKSGEWYECRDAAIRWPNGQMVRMEIATNITQRKKIEAQLTHEAMHDSLTGILNRRAIIDSLEKELARANRDQTLISVAMIDLDRFKQVNDTFGHGTGDDVLRQFTQRVRTNLRKYDLLGRMGGDEFLIVAPSWESSPSNTLYQRIWECVRNQPFQIGTKSIPITVSIGITFGTGDTSVDKLLSQADKALYRAKKAGRDRFVISD